MLIMIIPTNKPNQGNKDVYDKNYETLMKEKIYIKTCSWIFIKTCSWIFIKTCSWIYIKSHVHGQEERTNASINSAGKAVSVHTES